MNIDWLQVFIRQLKQIIGHSMRSDQRLFDIQGKIRYVQPL